LHQTVRIKRLISTHPENSPVRRFNLRLPLLIAFLNDQQTVHAAIHFNDELRPPKCDVDNKPTN